MKRKVILLLSLICLLSSCSNYKSLSFDLVVSNHLEIEAQRCEHGNIINLDYMDTIFIIRRYETYLNEKYDGDYVNRYMGFVELNGFNESINSISSNYNIYK